MSQKYQREIEEILGSVEGPRPHVSNREQRSFLRSSGAAFLQLMGGRGWHISPGRIMLGSLVLLLVALLIKGSMPGIVGPMMWTGIILFILGYALFFINPPPYEKRWRGRLIERPPRRFPSIRWRKGS